MVTNLRPPSSNKPASMQSGLSVYQADQQVKILHLHAEIESLLLQLQAIKRQRQEELPAADSCAAPSLNRQPAAAHSTVSRESIN